MTGQSESDFLQQMAASSRRRAEAAKRLCPEPVLLQKALATPLPPPLRRSAERFDLIAELKLRSPAVGQLTSSSEDVVARVSTYARAGAAAVSVLTEPSRFDGSMRHLEIAARALAALRVPAMRKDFLVDPYQIIEARMAGAGGVLVIVRMLSRSEIDQMLDCARTLGLFVLLEAFDERDIDGMHGMISDARAAGAGRADRVSPGVAARAATQPILAGLNCRDLTTLQIVPERLLQLVNRLPADVPRVAESGVVSAEDAARVAEAGYEYALVGSALMQGGDPHALAADMLAAGRGRRAK